MTHVTDATILFDDTIKIIHQLTNDCKKQGKNFTRNSKTPTTKNFKEIFHTNFSKE
jgi:hypothetical protein